MNSGPFATLGLAALLTASTTLAATPTTFRDALRGGGKGPVMVALPGGPVQLGDARRAITLSPFAIAQDDVTNAEFAAFLDHAGEVDADGIAYLITPERGSAEISSASGRHRVARGRERLPVTGVSWRGAIAYAQWLSHRTGRRYFLPTEAQWEYAARADSASAYPWGETFNPAKANCGAPPEAFALKVVGSYPANAFGLNDMIGNVWQWAADCFPADPDDLDRHDPSAYAADCVTPSIRGGAAPNAEALCKPTFRVNYWWRGAVQTIGFRVVRLDVLKDQGA